MKKQPLGLIDRHPLQTTGRLRTEDMRSWRLLGIRVTLADHRIGAFVVEGIVPGGAAALGAAEGVRSAGGRRQGPRRSIGPKGQTEDPECLRDWWECHGMGNSKHGTQCSIVRYFRTEGFKIERTIKCIETRKKLTFFEIGMKLRTWIKNDRFVAAQNDNEGIPRQQECN